MAYVDDSAGYERVAVAPLDQSAAPEYLTRDDAGILHELVASPAGTRLAFANNRAAFLFSGKLTGVFGGPTGFLPAFGPELGIQAGF